MGRKKKDFLVGLDIGTTKVTALVGQPTEEGIEILGIGSCPSEGARRGVIINVESTTEAVKNAVDEAERTSGCQIRSVYVSLAGEQIRGQNSHGIGAVKEEEVSKEDVKGAIEAAMAISIPQDRQILHCIPQSYQVDGQDWIKDPVGISGVRLEIRAYLVTCTGAAMQNTFKVLTRVGLDNNTVVLQQLATSEAVLSQDEKDLGVAVVDIGGGMTDIAIFHQGSIRYIATVPVGGKYITNDIAIGLRTPLSEAEKIKIRHGCVLLSLDDGDELIEVPSVGGREPREVSRQTLVRIVEPRAQEILSLVNREILRSGYEDLLGAGVVLTGGSTLLEGLPTLAEQVFNLPARSGYPFGLTESSELARSPLYATGVGLIKYGCQGLETGGSGGGRAGWFGKIYGNIKRWFSDFI